MIWSVCHRLCLSWIFVGGSRFSFAWWSCQTVSLPPWLRGQLYQGCHANQTKIWTECLWGKRSDWRQSAAGIWYVGRRRVGQRSKWDCAGCWIPRGLCMQITVNVDAGLNHVWGIWNGSCTYKYTYSGLWNIHTLTWIDNFSVRVLEFLQESTHHQTTPSSDHLHPLVSQPCAIVCLL